MAVPNLSVDQIRAALKALEQASYNHDQWSEALSGTLACHLAPDQRDLDRHAHRLCRFGQWLYQLGADGLGGHPAFVEIEAEHKRMHQYAAKLLRASMEDTPIPIDDFERFRTTRDRLRLEIVSLKYELQDALYNVDALTGTPSRVGMLTKLREQQDFVRRKMHPCVIAMMDLDHFKAVNDQHGHVIADQVLVALARYAMAHLRAYDKVFRYGGEEFLFCLPDTDLSAGRDFADQLREELGSLPHELPDKNRFYVTVSFGLALLDPDVPVEQSIDRADRALYAAKNGGRNHVAIWDVSMGDRSGTIDGSD